MTEQPEARNTLLAAAIAYYQKHRLIRFLLVGSINTGFSYLVYALFLFAGLAYPLASLMSLIAGIFFSFYTQGKFVFQNTARDLFWRFVLVWGLIYFANIAIIGALVHLGLNAYASGAVALVPVTLLSYLLQKLIVFSKKTAVVHRPSLEQDKKA